MKSRLLAVDGLRGIFALLVILYHCSVWLPLPFPNWVMSMLRIWGIYGVEGFFVISGIALSVSTPYTQFDSVSGFFVFLGRRYCRILPLYVVLVFWRSGSIEPTAPHLLELSMLFGLVDAQRSSLTGGWSIGVEFVFYILFPLLVLIGRGGLARPAVLVILAALLLGWHSLGFDPGAKLATQNAWYVYPANHLFFFVAGWFSGFIYRRHGAALLAVSPQRRYLLGLCFAVFASICVCGVNSDQIELMVGWNRIILALLVVLLVGATMFIDVRGKLPVFLGDISYAVYLIHPFVVRDLLPHLGFGNVWLQLIVVIALSIPLAFLTHRYFEAPVQRLFRKSLPA